MLGLRSTHIPWVNPGDVGKQCWGNGVQQVALPAAEPQPQLPQRPHLRSRSTAALMQVPISPSKPMGYRKVPGFMRLDGSPVL